MSDIIGSLDILQKDRVSVKREETVIALVLQKVVHAFPKVPLGTPGLHRLLQLLQEGI